MIQRRFKPNCIARMKRFLDDENCDFLVSQFIPRTKKGRATLVVLGAIYCVSAPTLTLLLTASSFFSFFVLLVPVIIWGIVESIVIMLRAAYDWIMAGEDLGAKGN